MLSYTLLNGTFMRSNLSLNILDHWHLGSKNLTDVILALAIQYCVPDGDLYWYELANFVWLSNFVHKNDIWTVFRPLCVDRSKCAISNFLWSWRYAHNPGNASLCRSEWLERYTTDRRRLARLGDGTTLVRMALDFVILSWNLFGYWRSRVPQV